jgi:hypothetical protein
MKGRVVVAGVLGGLAVFIWGFISHMVLPLGEAGVSPLPGQEAVLQVLSENVHEKRIYVFPAFENDPDYSKMTAAYTTGPHGILALTPPGGPFNFPKALGIEATTNVLGALLAAFLLAAAGAGAAGWATRLGYGVALGAFASVAIDFSYWNWYGFPGVYTLAQLTDAVVGWALAALVIGWWLGRGRAA